MTLKKGLVGLLLSAAIGATASVASASTYVFDLFDHDGAAKAATQDYGIRLDNENPLGNFFSFENLGTDTNFAQLTYDDVAMTASIKGKVARNSDDRRYWLNYTFTGLTDLGGGAFTALSGSGMLDRNNPMQSLALGSAADGNGVGFYFKNDGFRLPGNPGVGFVGNGWIFKGEKPGFANDFLFTAALNRDDSVISPVPVPAAGLMLLAGLGGFGLMRRRQK